MEPIQYPETAQALYAHLHGRLADVVPDFELREKAEIAAEVNRLKREKNAVILGHNYMEPALFHSVCDYTGDSLYLARVAAQSDADIIVFCGVRFMAESAKTLNPTRKVLLPSAKGGCSLAASIRGEDVRQLKALYPGVVSVTYINCYAEVKAECDYVCTSGNAEAVVQHLLAEGHERILFLPDEYLSANVAKQTGMDVVYAEKEDGFVTKAEEPESTGRPLMIAWRGRCEVHDRFTVEDVSNARKQFPDVRVLSHPECSPEVVEASDYSGSTTEMIRYVEGLESGRYLLLTECSMGDNIAAQNPQREMIRMCSVRCPHMNEITLEETLTSLREERFEIEVDEDVRLRSLKSLERMLAIG